jgi:hypothetical protein
MGNTANDEKKQCYDIIYTNVCCSVTRKRGLNIGHVTAKLNITRRSQVWEQYEPGKTHGSQTYKIIDWLAKTLYVSFFRDHNVACFSLRRWFKHYTVILWLTRHTHSTDQRIPSAHCNSLRPRRWDSHLRALKPDITQRLASSTIPYRRSGTCGHSGTMQQRQTERADMQERCSTI